MTDAAGPPFKAAIIDTIAAGDIVDRLQSRRHGGAVASQPAEEAL